LPRRGWEGAGVLVLVETEHPATLPLNPVEEFLIFDLRFLI